MTHVVGIACSPSGICGGDGAASYPNTADITLGLNWQGDYCVSGKDIKPVFLTLRY